MIKRKKPRFLRQDWSHLSLLGRRRRNKQVWRKPRGRHSKLRKKKKGHRKQPSMGYGSARAIREKIHGLKPHVIYNDNGLQHVKKDEIVLIAKIGMRKKYEIAKKALHAGIKIANLDAKRFIEEVEKTLAKRKEEKTKYKAKEKKQSEKKEKKESVLEKEIEKEKKDEKELEEEKKTLMKPEETQQEEHIKIKDKKLIQRMVLEK